MKKLYFYLLLLSLWGLGGLFGNFASAQVSVELIGKTSTVPPQVFFTVSWGTKAPYDNKIWVLAQVSTSGIGSEERALVTEVSATGATASTVTGHRGFWLETSGDNGSATVTATLKLADGVENFNWCVYAFDYPPNAVFQSDGSYRLRGSPPFTINGYITEPTNTFGPGTCITSITDATDNPEGIVPLSIAWYAGGEASQTVTVSDAITLITFTTGGATSVTTSGLPDGVSGTWSSPYYTVSGIPILTGTYNYTLTAENGNDDNSGSCASVIGTIKVEALPGTYQNQGGCTFTQPEVVSTFALFPATYSASTFVTLTDERDRNNYTVVKIGGRWWMAQNLNYQADLTWQADARLPTTHTGGAVAELIGQFWCPGMKGSYTSSRASCDVWGALYSWETAMMRDGKYAGSSGSVTAWPGDGAYCSGNGCTNNMNQGGRGICPPNWHVPTDEEWGDLFNAMETGTKNHNTGTGWRGTDAGRHAKAACNCEGSDNCATESVSLWTYNSSNYGLDTYNFRGLGANRQTPTGFVEILGTFGEFWSASAADINNTLTRHFRSSPYSGVHRQRYERSIRVSVRCVQD